MRISFGPGIVRHPATRNDRDSFRTPGDYICELLAQGGTTLGTWQWRQVNICVKGNDGNVEFFQYVFKRHCESMTEQRVFRISDIKIRRYELVQNVFGHFAMDRQVKTATRKLSIGPIARYHREGWHTRQ